LVETIQPQRMGMGDSGVDEDGIALAGIDGGAVSRVYR
jgi:hypothetical protein